MNSVLILLCAVVMLTPIPRQAPNKGSSGTQKPANATNASANQAAPTPAISQKNSTSDKFKNDPDRKPPENKEEAVTVSKLPTANVTIERNPKRDVWDWLSYVFNIGLAAAGIIGVCLAVRTLRVLKLQALSMGRQTTHLKNSVIAAANAASAAQRSAEFAELATKKSERADLLLEYIGIINAPDQPFGYRSKVGMRFRNFGRTRASNVVYLARLIVPDQGNEIPPPIVPQTLGAGGEQRIEFQPFGEWLSKDTFDAVNRGELTMNLYATITYIDAFSDPHTTKWAAHFDASRKAFGIDKNEAD
ncbi:MAG TPA: hypothetical protein VGG14_16200 [Candidatus Sulfotelmatobacter sp.]|jgi:hypothetical protein